jgi:glycosyltransferase involved in cell wall biosynthesis
MTLLQILWAVLTVLAGLPVVVILVQALAAGRTPVSPRRALGPRPRVAVLVPAHNEAAGIAATVRSIVAQLAPGDRLVVVADNCADDTAAVARAAGAEVIERHDTERRGKGFALDFGVRHLSAAAPDVLVMVDADCLLGPEVLDAIGRHSTATGRPVQALYLMHAPADAGLRARIAEFAWVVRNHVRPQGAWRLGGPCQLMGTGMAFPWALIAGAQLASGHLVEDMKLGIDLALAGHAPVFAPWVRVTSRFPEGDAASRAQRTRWEHGHLATLLHEGPRLLVAGLLRLNSQLLALSADLLVPPLALLVMLQGVLTLLNLALAWGLGWQWPAALSLASLVMLFAAVMVAWAGHGRHVIALRELAMAPLYALWKLPVYGAFLLRRQVDWVRAKRDGE